MKGKSIKAKERAKPMWGGKKQARSKTKRVLDKEEYANDKVWLAVGGMSSSRGNMCVGTNCRQEFIRLVVR